MTEAKPATQYAIHSDPEIMGGTPVFVGTRVPFQTLLNYLTRSGFEDFLHQFPSVNREQALAALRQAGELLVTHACPAR